MVLRKRWVPGDHLVRCDRTGFTVYASTTAREWNGLRVRDRSWEPRHAQDFVRGVHDRQGVIDARPQPPIDSFPTVGAASTSIATEGVTGATIITVAATEGLSAGDALKIVTDCGAQRTTISSIGASEAITIANALNSTAARGNLVLNITNTTTATDNY